VKRNKIRAYVHHEPSEILGSLFGLKDVRILAVSRVEEIVEILIESVIETPNCKQCGKQAQLKDRPEVAYVDLPCFGEPARVIWRKHRFRCVNTMCPIASWVHRDHRIAASECQLTTRAAKWVTAQVGPGRTVSEVARELRCDWDAVNNAVMKYGAALLEADRKRLNKTTAVGLDETSFVKLSRHTHKNYATTVADVENHQIIDILPTRNYVDVAGWIDKQPKAWKERIRFGALDMSNLYAAVYSVVLPKAAQVVDPFHAVQLANRALDDVRRRVQHETQGHRGRKDDPLYRVRRVLLTGEEKLKPDAAARLQSLLELGDPNGEVAIAYRVKERLRDFYAVTCVDTARTMLDDLVGHCTKPAMPPEIQKLGRTLKKWFDKICNFHIARVSNGPTEALNNLIKRIKRIGFGFRNFENYRIRALLYAGKPNWRVLGSIVVT
jgi:transposase